MISVKSDRADIIKRAKAAVEARKKAKKAKKDILKKDSKNEPKEK